MSSGQPVYPSRELLRRGPPHPGDKEAHRREKWCRVSQIVGVQAPNGDFEFVTKGPFTIPMGVRRRGVSLGQSDKAWLFFTHPYHVFQADGGFFNLNTRPGILAATLVERAQAGIILYDEVGTSSTERVSETYYGALGGMRHRLFGCNPLEATEFYTRAFITVDLALLRTFRVMTLLLKSRNPRLLFQELDKLLSNRTVFSFFGEMFSPEELKAIRRGALASAASAQGPRSSVSLKGATEQEQPFRIVNDDFATAERLIDGNNRQIVGVLKSRLDRFRSANQDIIDAIENRRKEAEVEANKLYTRIEAERSKREAMKGIGRFISGRLFNIDQAQNELNALKREIEELDRKYESLPGYDEIKGTSYRFQSFNDISKSIERLATNVFDYNVGLNQIKEMEDLATHIYGSYSQEERTKNLSRYSMRLRVDICPRIMRVFAISAYVLRRPESLTGEGSKKNVGRVNAMAERLIEYFRHVSYEGKKTLGEAFDDGWGQVRLLEARL